MTGPSPAPSDRSNGNRPNGGRPEGDRSAGNRLGGEISPYLLQHKDNPVHWMPWGEAALARARQEDKPIILSVGYAACHWCHVMAHESFEDERIAGLMNEGFVNIKVDREERPDLDAIYQAALHMMGEQGGWPLTMFLTPAGEPFWGGTYFPPTARYGRPGFPDVLQSVARVYKAEPERVQKNVTVLREGLAKLAEPAPGEGIPPAVANQIAERLAHLVDPFRGGVGGAPKFPQPGILEQLWRAWKRAPDEAAGEPFKRAVEVTLTNMCQGGIYDHLGGGFARYAVDDRWLVPHFEKMLYDNAQLIDILTLVWQDTKSKLYARRIEETVGWALREMVTEKGGFASSFDADSEGEEGKFYVWTEAEIDTALGDDSAFFKPFYDVTPSGNWEGHTILNRLSRMQLATDEVEARLAALREKLLEVRAQRIPPGKDDKVLADWNGLMIAALAFVGGAFGRPDWIAAAVRAFAFVRDEMTEQGRLRHSWRGGTLRHPATLDDYANLCRAALALYEATGDRDYVDQAEAWVATIDTHYASAAGGYYFAADDTPDLITRAMTAADSAVPAGNGTLAGIFARLFHLTGKDDYRDKAARIVAAFSGALAQNFVPLSTLINNSDLLSDALQIVLAGAPNAPDTAALRAAVDAVSLPNRILATVPPGADLPPGHPAAGKGPVDARAAAYVCRGTVCSAPLTDPDDLRAALAGR